MASIVLCHFSCPGKRRLPRDSCLCLKLIFFKNSDFLPQAPVTNWPNIMAMMSGPSLTSVGEQGTLNREILSPI